MTDFTIDWSEREEIIARLENQLIALSEQNSAQMQAEGNNQIVDKMKEVEKHLNFLYNSAED